MPGPATNGRAITRPMRWRSATARARSQNRVQLVEWDDPFVRGDLNHRVGRRVEDQVAGRQLLRAELLDDRGPRRGLVAAEAAPARRCAELVEDQRENPCGNVGSACLVTSPAISQ